MFNSEKLFFKYFNQRAIIWHSSQQHREQYNYDETIKASEIVKILLQEFIKNGQSNIGVLFEHSAVIVPVILGILDSGASFCCLDPKQSPTELKEMIKLLRCHIGIADKDFLSKHSQEYETLKEINIFNRCLIVLRLSVGECASEDISPYSHIELLDDIYQSSKPMFCCSTSGTTGQPKMIQVPFKCLMPNVISLSQHYEIKSSDVIYISSPPTFDPFVVDLLLGLFNGATILMVSKELRLSTNFLLSSFRTNSVTVMQITPSLFRRFPIEAIQNQLVSSSSTLRCLILGGEPFPNMDEVALWFKSNGSEVEMHTRLFNIYGITEVSCWSTIYEIMPTDIKFKSLIPIGLPLDQYTTLKVVDCVNKEVIENGIGELFIESKIRQCLIYENGQQNNVLGSTRTDDLVEIKSGSIYYKMRTNNMLKIYGRKVNLTKIENAAKSYWPINDACCVYDKASKSLNLFVQGRDGRKYTKKEILQGLREKLLEHEIPNEIHFVDEFPLSCHGKISKSKLLGMIDKSSVNFHCNFFVTKLEENLPAFNVETTLKLSFLAAGGNSALGLQLINELEAKFNIVDTELITMLLSHEVSMDGILLHLQNFCSNNRTKTTPEEIQAASNFTWCHDFAKCIDAAPAICIVDNKKIVSVGSHSHILKNIDLASGQLLSTLTLPDRIECQVVQLNDFGIVGCYDGVVYCFDLRNGLQKWNFNSNGMVKSKLCIIDGFVVFGNYNSKFNLWCVRSDDGALIWNTKIGEKSIYSGIVETPNNKLFVATLDGVCARLESSTGHLLWEIKLQSPIFSTAKIVQEDTIIVAEVLGIVHCIDLSYGKIVCSFKAAGNIYSSIESIDKNTICFGCYDKSVYCVSCDASSFTLRWKVETSGQIFASPKSFLFESTSLVLACSTNGIVYVIDVNGELVSQFRIAGEIFSTPTVADDKAVIASRNNLLYCFDVQKILAIDSNKFVFDKSYHSSLKMRKNILCSTSLLKCETF